MTTPAETTTGSTITSTPTAPYTGTIPCATITTGGNANGAVCVFPFVYKGYSYYQCTVVGHRDALFWCATTNNYDVDQKWGNCQGNYNSRFIMTVSKDPKYK